jgi:maleylacetate reductase
VVYDPLLTLNTPVRVSAETGMNALAHCVEAAYSPRRTPEAEAIALAGARRLASALPAVVDDPDDVEARTDALAGAALAGRSLQNSSMGVHHGLAQLVGGLTGIPHGLANAVILPHAMRFNADVAPDEMMRIGEALGDPDDAPGAVARLVERLGLPARLRDCDVGEEDLDAVARMSQASHAVQANLRPVGESDARAILADAY